MCEEWQYAILFSTPLQMEDHVPATVLVTWKLAQLMRQGGHTPPAETVGCV